MKTYSCTCCGYHTHIKTHYTKHMNTIKHKKQKMALSSTNILEHSKKEIKKAEEDNSIIEEYDETINMESMLLSKYADWPEYVCKYCGQVFKQKQSMYRHIRYTCKNNKDEDFVELVRLLNKQLEVKDRVMESMQHQIEKLTNKLQIQNINNGTNIQGSTITTTNIQLLNYNQTDYDFLKETDFLKCFQQNNHCVKALIEKVHFNKNKPENMNIYISSIKGKFIMVYRDNKWQIRDRKQQIDDMYESNELILENWYDEYQEKYPHIIKSFTRYLKNKEGDNELINNIKYEILMMLYNKHNSNIIDMIEDD